MMIGRARLPLASIRRCSGTALLAFGALVFVAPFIVMFFVSLKPPEEIYYSGLRLWPRNFHAIENYQAALAASPLLRFMLNGLIVCVGILAFQILFAVPCAYALAKLPFRGRDTLFALILLGLLIPAHAPAIPLYVMFYNVGLLDTYAAMIAPFSISVFGIFLFRQMFKALPDDLILAARMDGLSEWSILWRIIVPIAWPAMTAFSIFSIVNHWNGLFWPMIVITSIDLAPPTLGIVLFRDVEAGTSFGQLMAGAVLINAPLVVGFLLAQRRFIDGIAFSGIR